MLRVVAALLLLSSWAQAADAGAPATGRVGARDVALDWDDELALPIDLDLRLTDRYFALSLGGSVATGLFGAVSLGLGLHHFAQIGVGSQQSFFLGLTLTSMGVAALISGGTGVDGNVRAWQQARAAWLGATDGERRLIREGEAARLQRQAVNRAIALAADGTFLGLGVVMLAVAPQNLGVPLLMNGAFLLSLDVFRLAVDDQVSREWTRRNDDAFRGYFGLAPRVAPWFAPSDRGAPGFGVIVASTF